MADGHFDYQKVGAIIQVRMGSSRLPGKVLKALPENGTTTLLEHIINRIPSCFSTHIATSTNLRDDAIIKEYPAAFRGSEEDVLSRFFECAKLQGLSTIIRLTGDNPLIDGEKIKAVVNLHLETKSDYTKSEGLPLGCNVEVFSFAALEKANQKATTQFDREHVTPYLRTTGVFKVSELLFDGYPNYRLTLDYPTDFEMISQIFSTLGEKVTLDEAISFLNENPEVAKINNDNKQLS